MRKSTPPKVAFVARLFWKLTLLDVPNACAALSSLSNQLFSTTIDEAEPVPIVNALHCAEFPPSCGETSTDRCSVENLMFEISTFFTTELPLVFPIWNPRLKKVDPLSPHWVATPGCYPLHHGRPVSSPTRSRY